MKLQDAVYNWLTITVVAHARPDDAAAQETERFLPICCVKIMRLSKSHIQKKTTSIQLHLP
ncbi:hypothetical protein LR68_01352 [Anoxybacillus sp. BCO1]|nr:hypothetical protein LR68_01352 [Anoxybacillus sp. BCO1]